MKFAHVFLLGLTFAALGLAEFGGFESGHRIAIITALLTSLPAIGRMLMPPAPPSYLDGEPTPVERPQKP